jgi:hypothetical protein
MISRSPMRGSFTKNNMLKRADESELNDYTDLFDSMRRRDEERENDPKWKIDNLEYDLRSTDWILEKTRNSRVYAQNLYAALCNNEFTRNQPWQLLTEKSWSCSWRHAGGVIADMRQEGDYIDWYCSGITNEPFDEADPMFTELTKEQQEQVTEAKSYVSESIVTDEIRQDLLNLGWIVRTTV